MEVPSHSGKEQVHLSLWDKPIGLHANNPENDTNDWVSDDEEDEHEENENPCCPKLWLSKEEKGIIGKPWRQTLITKLLVDLYKTLFQRINSLWKPKAVIDLVEMDKKFFLVKFDAMEDYDFTNTMDHG